MSSKAKSISWDSPFKSFAILILSEVLTRLYTQFYRYLVEGFKLAHVDEWAALREEGRQENVGAGAVEGGADGDQVHHVGYGGSGEAAPRPLRLQGDVHVGGAAAPLRALRATAPRRETL